MRCELAGRFVLSDDASEAEEDVEAFVEEANEELLVKGARQPEEGAHVQAVDLKGDTLRFRIESGGDVRAHEAVLRLRKGLQKVLGPEHHVGVREVEAETYEMSWTLDREPKRDLHVPFVRALRFDGDQVTMEMEDLSEEFLQRNYADRLVNLVEEKIDAQHYEGKGEYWDLMWESPEKEPAWEEDPTEAMLEADWLKRGPTKGKWVFRERLTAVMRAMERIAVEEILEPLGFTEIMVSHHVPFDVWIKSGHLHGVPNEIYYVSEPATRDPDEWQRFVDQVKVTREAPTEELEGLVDLPTAGLCYAQCPNVYWSYQGKTVEDEDFPITVYDRAAVSNRYESGGRHGMERVDEFHRIEPVYIGTRDQLVDLRDGMIERYKHVFNDVLDLEWRMAWVTPFYMQQEGQESGLDEEDEEAREQGTIDFEAYLPYRGDREEAEWLEFQNLSIVGDKFTDAFNIKAQTLDLWSGCSGIGLERWAVAFLGQKGLDPEDWPEGFREHLPELPPGSTYL
jgi:seryl-tRNA synthetase